MTRQQLYAAYLARLEAHRAGMEAGLEYASMAPLYRALRMARGAWMECEGSLIEARLHAAHRDASEAGERALDAALVRAGQSYATGQTDHEIESAHWRRETELRHAAKEDRANIVELVPKGGRRFGKPGARILAVDGPAGWRVAVDWDLKNGSSSGPARGQYASREAALAGGLAQLLDCMAERLAGRDDENTDAAARLQKWANGELARLSPATPETELDQARLYAAHGAARNAVAVAVSQRVTGEAMDALREDCRAAHRALTRFLARRIGAPPLAAGPPAVTVSIADMADANRAALAVETVRLGDGEARQTLIPGVEPLSLMQRDLAAHAARKAARRGNAPLPAGSLFDEVAAQQGDFFG